MTRTEAEKYCMAREWDDRDLKELLEGDLKYCQGDTVYLRPLSEIAKNSLISSIAISADGLMVDIEIVDDATTRFFLADWDKPKVISGMEAYDEQGETMWYYEGVSCSWFEEWMVQDMPSSKKRILLNKIRYLGD